MSFKKKEKKEEKEVMPKSAKKWFESLKTVEVGTDKYYYLLGSISMRTQKAVLFEMKEFNEMWYPLSQIKEPKIHHDGIWVKEWILKKNLEHLCYGLEYMWEYDF